MKKIPDNPTDRHPVMLLNQMRPGIQFTEISREGTPPNLTFTLGVTVDGKSYTGVGEYCNNQNCNLCSVSTEK